MRTFIADVGMLTADCSAKEHACARCSIRAGSRSRIARLRDGGGTMGLATET